MAETGPTKGKIKFKIVSPLAPVVEIEVDKVLLPLSAGDALILPRHAPLLSSLKSGKVITTCEGENTTYFVSSGIAEMRRDICALCAWGIAEKDVKSGEIRQRLEKLETHTVHSDLEKEMVNNLKIFLKMILSFCQ